MPRKLTNKPLSRDDAKMAVLARALQRDEANEAKVLDAMGIANEVARAALSSWYEAGYRNAIQLIPKLQVQSNLEVVASMPGWFEKKTVKNGYIMMCSLFNRVPRPVIMELDYNGWNRGGLTYRQLHRQARESLGFEPKVSLRMCPFMPWHQHITSTFPIPEAHAIPANDRPCTHLLGTTLIYFTYVHLND